MGRVDEALAESKRAQELDPLSPIIGAAFGHRLYLARQYDKAIEQCLKALEVEPDFAYGHFNLGLVFEQKADFEKAIAEFQKAAALSDRSSHHLAGLGHAYAVAGRRREAMKILNELKERSKHSYVPPFDIATVYIGLGEKDQAFGWLQKASEEHSFSAFSNLKADPIFDGLRSDPRFQDLQRRMGLPP